MVTNGIFNTHTSGLTSSIQDLSMKLDLFSSKNEAPVANLGKEVLELRYQCESLNKSLKNLSQVVNTNCPDWLLSSRVL